MNEKRFRTFHVVGSIKCPECKNTHIREIAHVVAVTDTPDGVNFTTQFAFCSPKDSGKFNRIRGHAIAEARLSSHPISFIKTGDITVIEILKRLIISTGTGKISWVGKYIPHTSRLK